MLKGNRFFSIVLDADSCPHGESSNVQVDDEGLNGAKSAKNNPIESSSTEGPN